MFKPLPQWLGIVFILKLWFFFFAVVGESLFTVARIDGGFFMSTCQGRENELLYLNSLSDVL